MEWLCRTCFLFLFILDVSQMHEANVWSCSRVTLEFLLCIGYSPSRNSTRISFFAQKPWSQVVNESQDFSGTKIRGGLWAVSDPCTGETSTWHAPLTARKISLRGGLESGEAIRQIIHNSACCNMTDQLSESTHSRYGIGGGINISYVILRSLPKMLTSAFFFQNQISDFVRIFCQFNLGSNFHFKNGTAATE